MRPGVAEAMNLDLLDHIIRVLWMLVMTVWLALATESNEPILISRNWRAKIDVLIVSVGWVILLLSRFNGLQLIPRVMFIRIFGAALTVIGLTFAVWARFYLGSNWSAYITLGLDHKLIRTGPYAIVRHPIYSGFMIALVGSV